MVMVVVLFCYVHAYVCVTDYVYCCDVFLGVVCVWCVWCCIVVVLLLCVVCCYVLFRVVCVVVFMGVVCFVLL